MLKKPFLSLAANVRHYCASQVESFVQQTAKHKQLGVVGNQNYVSRQNKEANDLVLNKNNFNDEISFPTEKKSVLEECTEEVPVVGAIPKQSFNFATHVNKSKTLQALVQMGVNLHKIEKKRQDISFILEMDFEKDMAKHIKFLCDVGVPENELGEFITKNPYIFKEDLDNLEVRINYLRSKLFSDSMIARIVTRSPFWLLFSTQRIDEKLGYFQKTFKLTGYDVRNLATKQPKLINYSIYKIKENYFTIKEQMGFLPDEIKSILLNQPNIFLKKPNNMLKTFEFVHKEMGIPLERIADFPSILTCRHFIVKQRHLYLKMLKRDQYKRTEPNYVSLKTLVSGTDAEFCSDVAKTSIDAFNTFLKTL